MDFLPITDDLVVDFFTDKDNLETCHRFEPNQLRAINAALSSSRPLLVRGEPGIGKSQLARAAAKLLGRAFLQHVVDSRTESHDLLWHFDAVGRLAEAQVIGALQLQFSDAPSADGPGSDRIDVAIDALRTRLSVGKYVHPRALWWAFDWESAKKQARKVGAEEPPQPDGGQWRRGCVVLIDEIDKAESDVPNGLLEALGSGQFTPRGHTKPVVSTASLPLVIITTNEERALPDAFIRRCLVLHLSLPDGRQALIDKLIERGHAHFQQARDSRIPRASEKVLRKAAELLADDRAAAQSRNWRPLPGQAEYLDLVRAVVVQSKGDFKRQEELIGEVDSFVLKKHPDAARNLSGETG